MKRDPLESFIHTNRSAFDQALPEHDLWSKIERELPSNQKDGAVEWKVVHKKERSIWRVLQYAAAVAAIVAVSVFGTVQYMATEESEGISASTINEINELSDYYDFEVKRKLEQLAAYESITEVDSELMNIDKIIDDLKIELEEVEKGNEEKIINAMINNFQLKVLILERMLEAKKSQFNNSETIEYEVSL